MGMGPLSEKRCIDIAITINDIAKKAGVSRSTVSRVINKKGYVSKDTLDKVEKAIKEYEFSPSATARSLSKKDTNTIGVIIPEADNAFFGEILKGISQVVDENDMTLIFCNTDNNTEKQEKALNMLKSQRVKGLILTPVNDYSDDKSAKKLQRQLDSLKIPIVILDRPIEKSQLDGVFFENFGSTYAATEVLIKEGHKNIGIITGNLNIKIGRDRYKGFIKAMKDYGIPIQEKYILEGDFSQETAYGLMKKSIINKNIPDAILTCNNRTTLGFLRAINEYEIKLGIDIAAIGIDKIQVLDILNYKFSYVGRDTVEMGRITMNKLLKRFEDVDKPKEITILPYKIILKGSEKLSLKNKEV